MGGDVLSRAWWRGFTWRWGRRLRGVGGWNRLMLSGGIGGGWWWWRRNRRGRWRRLLILIVAVLIVWIILLGIVGAVGGRVARWRGHTVPDVRQKKYQDNETHTHFSVF